MSQRPTAEKLSKMVALVVDDQFTMRKAMTRLLSNYGFGAVLESADGASAIKLLGTCPIDLVITDLFMPEVDGFNTLKKIRAQNFGADIPVIVVTGEGGRDEIMKAVDLGADDYILKPFQIPDFTKKITSVLARYQSPTPLLKLLRDGDRLFLAANFEDALKCFEAAERMAPESPRAKFCKALTLKNLGEGSLALEILQTIVDRNPSYFKAFRAIGDLALEQGQTHLAIRAIHDELQLNPKQVERQMQFARLLANEGDLIGALEHFRIALRESPKNKEALIEAGLALGEIGDMKQALAFFRRARRFYPNWIKPLETAAQLLSKKSDAKAALTFLNDELLRQPDRPDLRILLAKFLHREKDFSSSLKVINDGLMRSSQNLDLLKAKALLLKLNHQTANACEIYQEIFKLEANQTNQSQLAHALIMDKQFQAAFDLLATPVDPTTDQVPSRLMMIEALKHLSRPVQALHLLDLVESKIRTSSQGDTLANLKPLRSELLRMRALLPKLDSSKKKAS